MPQHHEQPLPPAVAAWLRLIGMPTNVAQIEIAISTSGDVQSVGFEVYLPGAVEEFEENQAPPPESLWEQGRDGMIKQRAAANLMIPPHVQEIARLARKLYPAGAYDIRYKPNSVRIVDPEGGSVLMGERGLRNALAYLVERCERLDSMSTAEAAEAEAAPPEQPEVPPSTGFAVSQTDPLKEIRSLCDSLWPNQGHLRISHARQPDGSTKTTIIIDPDAEHVQSLFDDETSDVLRTLRALQKAEDAENETKA